MDKILRRKEEWKKDYKGWVLYTPTYEPKQGIGFRILCQFTLVFYRRVVIIRVSEPNSVTKLRITISRTLVLNPPNGISGTKKPYFVIVRSTPAQLTHVLSLKSQTLSDNSFYYVNTSIKPENI